jgi:membrane-bound lytic murein transglycosylase A
VGTRNDEIRQFFEQEFVLYQIRNQDQTPAGVITGYYEPLLNGSRRRTERFVHPVYGLPDDLLFLDSRAVAQASRGKTYQTRIVGRQIIVSAAAIPGDDSQPRSIDLTGARADIRDKRMRVRIEGDRIVPYYTREQIDQGKMADGEVIAWVDDYAALYSMQVQGSGKIRLPDGMILRVAYAEQNGHPFLPPVGRARDSSRPAADIPQTRGIPLRKMIADDEPLTRGGSANRAVRRQAEDLSLEVARVVELLLSSSASQSTHRNERASRTGRNRATIQTPAQDAVGSTSKMVNGSREASAFSSDPSYVFFRQIPNNANGPIGALGVPLTAGRSIAVDPRTTPLGAPVFISSHAPQGGTSLNRLVLAQDTGGAIRGAVRADYFWGFGHGAGQQASRMKQIGQMWLLIPKALELPALAAARTRGPGAGDAECVIPDPDLCVE